MITSNTTSHEETWHFGDAIRFVRSWRKEADDSTDDAPKFVLGVIHGLGDHSGRFDGMARWFAARGVLVYCFDQVGHGRSPGPRMVIPSYVSMLRDIDEFLRQLREAHPDCQVGLFGQSMGGNLVLNHQFRDYSKTTFAVAGSPMLRAIHEPGALQMTMFRLLAKLIPNRTLDVPSDPKGLTRDPDAQQAFLDDPLVQRTISIRLGLALIESGAWLLNESQSLSTPTLITHGDADPVTCHQASIELANRVGNPIDLKIWPDGPHDLHHDIVQEEYFEYVYDWMIQHLDATT
ncbi:MAG: lysophospholipase [Planctomycetota bacterium]